MSRSAAPESSSSQPASRGPLLAVMAIAMAPAVGLGVARFAYALVLPDMQADFGWSYAEAGFPNAMNAFGYFVGAAAAGRAAGVIGSFRLLALGGVVAALTTALSAVSVGLVSLSVLRFVAGVAGAFALVAGGAVAIAISERAGRRASLVVSLLYAGPPFGIIVSSAVAPLALAGGEPWSWRVAWGALGLASALLLIPLAAPSVRKAEGDDSRAAGRPAPLRPMALILAAYCVFGAGYITYMTFMIAFLRQGGAGTAQEAEFWCAIGLAGLAAPWLWARTLGRLKGGWGMGVATLVTTLGAVLPLFAGGFAAEILSGVVFGNGMFAATAATTIFVRRNLAPAAWASGVGAMTVSFSLGQTVGPVLTGLVTDWFGGLTGGLAFGAALLALAAILALCQRDLGAIEVAPAPSMADDPAAERTLSRSA
ncbi:YbfB/YjiJ family MFS transporter [Hansschlegelia sp.]|uniref:YbfB/YjiJ family MFS transporter n=1 Tax=Hansschlegelia sp. TaxID=2041892 RepID=UPI002BFD11B5|nr:YbfB/YjiJ family MFS transporter [Hansschlegelia sp.]HVI28294.1 YbfB/YjiJ family MFS transporter [Hansschlegelia sp.]